MVRRLLAVLVACACGAACMYGLQPRATLQGMPFDAAKASSIHAGLTEAEVRRILGEPFEVKAEAGYTHWRYYERFTPRGCNPPTLSQELQLSFVAGAVVSSKLAMPPAWP
jgi:outer membrane protein assembly factor BamE (lipoprotein component of BamABCDE complex)